jgi:hypothetical protein
MQWVSGSFIKIACENPVLKTNGVELQRTGTRALTREP